MKILLLGSKGQFGLDAGPVFEREEFDWAGADLPEVDIAERSSLARLLDANPCDVVINAAAYTNVDGAECQRAEAFRVNALGARTVAEACRERRLTLVYISTDYVFPGLKPEGYRPDEQPGPPVNAYGESKLAGERAVAETLKPEQYLICRTQWLYGTTGRNFVETILKTARVRGRLKVVNDQYGVPTHTRDLAEQIAALLRLRASGFAHTVGGGGPVTWFDFAREILDAASVACELAPCASEDYPRPAKRPAHAWLLNTNVPKEAVRHWTGRLREHLAERAASEEGSPT